MSAHDQWLSGYYRVEGQAWCSNHDCPNHTDPVNVTFESEYGQSWATPEECPDCGSAWLYDPPKGEDE